MHKVGIVMILHRVPRHMGTRMNDTDALPQPTLHSRTGEADDEGRFFGGGLNTEQNVSCN